MKDTELPKTVPICCNTQMYPCGGVLGGNEVKENHWRCAICGNEVHDIKAVVKDERHGL